MDTTVDSAASGRGAVPRKQAAAIGSDGNCGFSRQVGFISDEESRRLQSISGEWNIEVARIARAGRSPAPPMYLLTGDPQRTSTEAVSPSHTPVHELSRFNVPAHWAHQVSSKNRVSHVGREDLPAAQRTLSPEPRPTVSMFKGSEFRLGVTRKSVSISPAPRYHDVEQLPATGSPVGKPAAVAIRSHAVQSPVREEQSKDSLSLGSSSPTRPHFGDDTVSVRSRSSMCVTRLGRSKTQTEPRRKARNQLDGLGMSNLLEMTSSTTPEQLQQMAVWSAIGDGAGRARSPIRPASQMSGVFLALKYSPAQLGVDGYGAPASLPEDIDELLNRTSEQGNARTKREVHEALCSRMASPTLKRSLKTLPLADGFMNDTTVKILKNTFRPDSAPFGNLKSPVVSKHDLLLEKAQNVMHDTPSYKKHTCGFNMRGEMLVYSWAAPHDFRGQHANPRIHEPRKPPPPATSERAKFKGFADDRQRMLALSKASHADSLFVERKGVRLCEQGGVGFFPIAAGGGRTTREVKHKLQSTCGYHKYLNASMLDTKKDHKYDIPGDPEFKFKKATLLVDDKSKIAMSEEPLKGVWAGAPDLYPGSLVPSATRHRF
jgi:hypothetical protein